MTTEHLYGINQFLPADKVPEPLRNDYLKIATELEEADAEFFKGDPSSRTVRRLNNCYWDSLKLLVRIRVRDPLFEEIGFSEEERPLVDYGLLSGGFLRDFQDMEVMRKESNLMTRFEEFNVFTFAQEIRDRYCRIIENPEVVAFRKDVEMLERELEFMEERYRKSSDRLVKILRYAKGAERVSKLVASIQERLPLFGRLQFKISRSIRLDTAEAEVVRATEGDIRAMAEAMKRVLKKRRDREQAEELTKTMLKSALDIPKTKARIFETREKIDSRLRSAEESSPATRYARLSSELSGIQKLYPQLSGRESSRGMLPVYYSETTGMTKALTVARIKEVIEIDKVLERQWHDFTWKRPDVIIVPGLGDGIYDAARDAFWISRRNLYPFKDPVVSAVALYRLVKTGGMVERYKEVKRMPRKSKSSTVAEEFVKEYNDCILREAKGFRKLSGKLQKWFRYEFAYEEGA
ncbi:MAG: hypothetical protein E3J72_19695 [Planctomycetota bacterium]|nr:MAG: hypothetical protein E3J72_19695 [Planctomycetota bacterium]